jgi:hypothetical protein
MERDLAPRIARLGSQLQAVQRLEPLDSQQAKPEERRNCRIGGIFLQTARRVDKRFLKHVGRVDASLQPLIEPKLNHSPQSSPVRGKDFTQRALLACLHALCQ